MTLLTSIDPLKELPVLLDPKYARTLISIDPQIKIVGTVDDLVPNTHSLYSAAITHLAPENPLFITPAIEITKEIGKLIPLYSINFLTMQSTNTAAYVGTIKLNGEVNTFSDQTYRTNTLTADPISPLNTVTFTVDDANAKISFDLYKDTLTKEYSFTNTNGSAELLFNGTTTFNDKEVIPTLPTGKWNSVTVGLSLSGQEALKRSRAGSGEQNTIAQEQITPTVVAQTTPVIPQTTRIANDHTNGGSIMAGIMNNNNFEIPKSIVSGNVSVAMGGAARSTKDPEITREEDLRDRNSSEDCSSDAAECEKM